MRLLVLLLSACLVIASASDAQAQRRTIQTRQCTFNDDCIAPLICEGGYCRLQCMTDRDCSSGWVCRNATPGRDVTAPMATEQRGVAPTRDARGRPITPQTVYLEEGETADVMGEMRWNQCMPPATAGVTVPELAVAGMAPAARTQPAGAVAVAAPARATGGGSRFWRDAEGALWFDEGAGGKSPGPRRLGGLLASDPSFVSSGGRDEAFFLGSDGALWTIARIDGKWTEMASLAGVLASAPTARLAGDGDDVLVRATGTDGVQWEIHRKAGIWGGWEPMR